MATARRVYGSGSTLFGADMGDSKVLNFTGYIERMEGLKAAVKAGVAIVEVGSSATNGMPNSINPFLVQYWLKDQLGFQGFVVTELDQARRLIAQALPGSLFRIRDLQSALVQLIAAGVDVISLSNRDLELRRVHRALKLAVEEKLISLNRIDSAVERVLSVKLAYNLIKLPSDSDTLSLI